MPCSLEYRTALLPQLRSSHTRIDSTNCGCLSLCQLSATNGVCGLCCVPARRFLPFLSFGRYFRLYASSASYRLRGSPCLWTASTGSCISSAAGCLRSATTCLWAVAPSLSSVSPILCAASPLRTTSAEEEVLYGNHHHQCHRRHGCRSRGLYFCLLESRRLLRCAGR